MKVLAVKKDRLDELTKFGFRKYGNVYLYINSFGVYRCLLHISADYPVISISEFDTDCCEDSVVIDIPDVIMELIEAGMVERYEDN